MSDAAAAALAELNQTLKRLVQELKQLNALLAEVGTEEAE